jgi:hypothetical protein
LQQAVRDLSAWVERGTEPPASTNYQVRDGQVEVPPTAADRKGIQPVVTLTANGGDKAVVKAGEPVEFEGTISVPPQAGVVAYADFDFDNSGCFGETAMREPINQAGTRIKVKRTFRHKKPGTYFALPRATSNRSGDRNTVFAQIRNLARVRVVVE